MAKRKKKSDEYPGCQEAERKNDSFPDDGFPTVVDKPSEGFFLAKRQMQDVLDRKIVDLRKKQRQIETDGRYSDLPILLAKIDQIEKFRDYVRNDMLWFKGNGD